MLDYLPSRKQRNKISGTRNPVGSTQSSILGPLLFKIDICVLFFIIGNCDIANYTDDSTQYFSEKNVEEFFNSLENVSSNRFLWFPENSLKGNASKCHLLISSGEKVHVNIGTSHIKNGSWERLLGIDISCKLSFENHINCINQICTKARKKIKSLARIAPFWIKKKESYWWMHFSNLCLVTAHYHGCFIVAD